MGRKKKKTRGRSADHKAPSVPQTGTGEITVKPSSKISPKGILLYALVLLGMTFLFFFLHYLSNQIPYDLAKKRFADAFAGSNLTSANYAPRRSEQPSLLMLIGDDQFGECQTSTAILSSAKGASSKASALERAIVPMTFEVSRKRCEELQSLLSKAQSEHFVDEISSVRRLKHRYWWGGKAIYGLLLQSFSVFHIRELMKSLTYLAWFFLAVLSFAYSPKMFAIIAPAAVFGVLFSGQYLLANIMDALPFLWCVIAVSGLVALMKYSSYSAINLFAFIAGMVSSYFWFYDGHAVFITSLFTLIAYFGSRIVAQLNPADSLKRTWSVIWRYIAGAVLSMLSMLTTKTAYLSLLGDSKPWQVFADFLAQTKYKMGKIDVEERLFDHNYIAIFKDRAFFGSNALAEIITWLSLLALLLAIGLMAKKVLLTQRFTCLFDTLPFVVALIFISARMIIDQDNPMIFVRYMSVLYALPWCFLVVAFLYRRRNEPHTPS